MYRGMSLTKSLTQNFSIFLSKTNPNRKERKRRSTFFSSSLNFFSSFILTIFVFANANSNAVVYQWMRCGGAGRSVFVYCENYYSHICIEWSRIMKASINTDRERASESEKSKRAPKQTIPCVYHSMFGARFSPFIIRLPSMMERTENITIYRTRIGLHVSSPPSKNDLNARNEAPSKNIYNNKKNT